MGQRGDLRGDSRVSDLIEAGHVRTALFLPQFRLDATGALHGLGTGYVACEMTQRLAAGLGVAAEISGWPKPAIVVERLKSGQCDLAFLGIEPSRVAELDFTPAIFEFDFTYLVPAGSGVRTVADVDRPGVRIAITHNHASALALMPLVRHAQLVGAELPDAALDLVREGHADALAFPRDVLLDLAPALHGSRVLDDAYGYNRVGIALRKGQPGRLAYLSEHVETAKASGLVAQLIESGRLRGFRVAAAG